MELTRTEAFNLVFNYLEKAGMVTYTNKFNRDRLIPALIQTEQPPWKYLGYTNTSGLSTLLKKNIKLITKKPSARKWEYHLLYLVKLKYCNTCRRICKHEEFSHRSDKVDGLATLCRACDSTKSKEFQKRNPTYSKQYQKDNYAHIRLAWPTYASKQRANKINRIPAWCDHMAIQNFYGNRPEGYHVDHIIPLQGEKVSGLHVLDNLQYLTADENLKKSNKYEVQ